MLRVLLQPDHPGRGAAHLGKLGPTRHYPRFVLVERRPTVDAEDVVTRHAVTLGANVDGRVEVTAGLSPTDRVVTSGSILLKAEADRQANS